MSDYEWLVYYIDLYLEYPFYAEDWELGKTTVDEVCLILKEAANETRADMRRLVENLYRFVFLCGQYFSYFNGEGFPMIESDQRFVIDVKEKNKIPLLESIESFFEEEYGVCEDDDLDFVRTRDANHCRLISSNILSDYDSSVWR